MHNIDEWLNNAQSLHRMFYGKSNIDLNYEIEFTKNVANRKKDFFSNKEQCGNSELDGAMVLPEPPSGKYYILLDSKLSLEDWKYDLTESFTHELTHLEDYLAFAKDYCNNNYVDIPKHDYWLAFYFWSEYHAKWLGYRCMFKQLASVLETKQLYELANNHLMEKGNKNLSMYTAQIYDKGDCDDYVVFLYEAIRYLAKISVLNDIVPPKCQVDIKWDEYLPVPRERAIMVEDFLAKHNTYEVIQGKFEVLRDKINYCFQNIMYIE